MIHEQFCCSSIIESQFVTAISFVFVRFEELQFISITETMIRLPPECFLFVSLTSLFSVYKKGMILLRFAVQLQD